MKNLKLNFISTASLIIFLCIFFPISSFSEEEVERNLQLSYCCVLDNPETDGCVIDPLHGQSYNHQCCHDQHNKCVGDISLWAVDYTWKLLLSCPTLNAPCAWVDPLLDDAVYQAPSGNMISRKAFNCVRRVEPTECTINPPVGCGPKTTWANHEYQTCTQAEFADKLCDD